MAPALSVSDCPTPPPQPAPLQQQVTRYPLVTRPDLSVIVVNYRRWRDTGRLIHELQRTQSWRRGQVEAVIVDNHSPPHPLVRRLRRLAGVSLRRWGRNRGFAQAVNEGCRLSQGQWLLLLNPDVALPSGFLDRLQYQLARWEADPRLGVVGFQLHNADGSPQASSGPFPTLAGTLARLWLPRARRKYAFRSPQRGPVPWATGCCLLLRRGCWRDLGGLDERFFLYYEDVDFCRRAWQRGWTVAYEPALSVGHLSPLHSRSVSPFLRFLTRHALLSYARKHWPAWQSEVLAVLIGMESLVRGWLARRTGTRKAVRLFQELRAVARAFRRDDPKAVRRILNRVVLREEHFCAKPQHRHSQPQPAGPAARMPGVPAALCSPGH